MTDDLSLSEDAFIFGDGVMSKKETVTLEKKVYDVVLKRNADLMHEKEELDTENHHLWTDNEVLRDDLRIAREENKNLRGALEAILDATQKETVSIAALRFVAYTALKDVEKCK